MADDVKKLTQIIDDLEKKSNELQSSSMFFESIEQANDRIQRTALVITETKEAFTKAEERLKSSAESMGKHLSLSEFKIEQIQRDLTDISTRQIAAFERSEERQKFLQNKLSLQIEESINVLADKLKSTEITMCCEIKESISDLVEKQKSTEIARSHELDEKINELKETIELLDKSFTKQLAENTKKRIFWVRIGLLILLTTLGGVLFPHIAALGL
tara:strand:- start:3565 stop:4212 length:648 start_codon:yes stop_codon:yes gene_type:complete